jgi:hypothetical protein
MSKTKKFEPSMGYIVTVNVHEVAVIRVAQALDVEPYNLGIALEKAGYKLEPDPFDISADTAKIIALNLRQQPLRVVKEEEEQDEQ